MPTTPTASTGIIRLFRWSRGPAPGGFAVFHTRDALDSDPTLESTADDLAAVDLDVVHPMTGPVFIEGVERGDVPAIAVVRH